MAARGRPWGGQSDYLSHELLGILLALPLISPQRMLGLQTLVLLGLAVLWILGIHTQVIRLALPVCELSPRPLACHSDADTAAIMSSACSF